MIRPNLLLLALLLGMASPVVPWDDTVAEAQGRKSRRRAPRRPAPPPIKVREAPPEASPEPRSDAVPQRGPTRIDFDDRLVQGQTNKSGAVYLYDRKELKSRSMLKERESFREEIVRAVYDR